MSEERRKSGSSVQHCFWLISSRQHTVPLISLNCVMEYNYSRGSSVVIVVLNQEIHLHKLQNTTACLAQPIIPKVVDQKFQILGRFFSTPADHSQNQNCDLVHHAHVHYYLRLYEGRANYGSCLTVFRFLH